MLTDWVFDTVQSTINEMLTDRGYTSEDGSLFQLGEDRVMSVVVRPQNPESSDGIDTFKAIITDMEKEDVHHAIIATYRGFSHHVNQYRESIKERNNVEIFRFFELMSPVVKHYSVPRHVRIDEDEKDDLFAKLGIEAGTEGYILPSILVTDPVSRYYGYKLGDVVRIQRSTNEYYYRIVI